VVFQNKFRRTNLGSPLLEVVSYVAMEAEWKGKDRAGKEQRCREMNKAKLGGTCSMVFWEWTPLQ